VPENLWHGIINKLVKINESAYISQQLFWGFKAKLQAVTMGLYGLDMELMLSCCEVDITFTRLKMGFGASELLFRMIFVIPLIF